jgi:hypothetical protein
MLVLKNLVQETLVQEAGKGRKGNKGEKAEKCRKGGRGSKGTAKPTTSKG